VSPGHGTPEERRARRAGLEASIRAAAPFLRAKVPRYRSYIDCGCDVTIKPCPGGYRVTIRTGNLSLRYLADHFNM
jgi:hypothetical protein